MNKKIKELQAKRREKSASLADLEQRLNGFDEITLQRDLTDEERKHQREAQVAFNKAKSEYDGVCRELSDEIADQQASSCLREKGRNTGARLRELLSSTHNGVQSRREIVLSGTAGSETGVVGDSGAVSLTIHDMIPTLNEGLGLPSGLSLVTGVTGNELWPVSVDDVAMEETGEVEALSAQVLNFDKLTPIQRRVALRVLVSNTAIDNAAFDLLGFVQQKFTLAMRKYIAEKVISQAAWNGNKGPFSGAAPAGTITLDATAYKNILKAVAQFADKGYDASQVCLVFDAATEAELKSTPKAEGQGGFIIENGKCAGYNYVVSHYINTKLDEAGKTLVTTPDKYIGIGLFNYEVVEQHGDVRLTVDSTSDGVGMKNVTSVILNTSMSFTDISVKTTTNGKKNTTTTAFALYKVAASA